MMQHKSQTANGVRFELDYDEHILYAMVANRRSFIQSLTLDFSKFAGVAPTTVEIRVTSLGQDLISPWVRSWNEPSSKAPIEFLDFESFEWNVSRLWDIKERQPAEIVVRVGEDEAKTAVFAAEVSSPNSWFASDDSLPGLAAFVQPNHPSLLAILDDAAKKLTKRGHQPMFSGYQVATHVPHMVEAIYDAVCDVKIRYSNPPASWSDDRQKIRDAQTVLVERHGTCLDTAVLFAGLLENVGLRPVLAIIPGHAFVGFWVSESLATREVSAIRDIVNFVDSGEIVLFETTVVCDSEQKTEFTQAISQGRSRINGLSFEATSDASAESALVDIVLCRVSDVGGRTILPMPARFVRPDGVVEVVEYKPESLSFNALIDRLSKEFAEKPVRVTGVDTNVPPRLKKWLDDLLDLSLRNPLVNFVRRSRGIDFVMPDRGIGVVEDLLHGGITFEMVSFGLKNSDGESVSAQNDRGGVIQANIGDGDSLEHVVTSAMTSSRLLANHTPEDFVRRARSLVSDFKSFKEESGSNGLFLALGSLVWVPEGKKEVRSPLILVPVNITAKDRSRHFFISLDYSSAVTPNFSLAEKLKRELGVSLDGLVNLQEDDSGIDVPGTIAHVRQKLTEAQLQGFRVDEDAVLGIFDFSTYRLWRDLIDNWRQFEKNPLVHHLIYSPNEAFQDPVTDEVSTDLDVLLGELPIEADSSQVKAVSQALAGKTFVMQGPPGTGKSQTITNLLARALNEGKRILFVAEKKDALDVVVERLDAVELRPYILDLHDKGMTYKAVKEQLADVIDLTVSADKTGYEAALREYSAAVAPLQAYRKDLHKKGKQGESLSSAVDNLLAIPGDHEMAVSGEFVSKANRAEVDEIRRVAEVIADIGPSAGTVFTNSWSLAIRTSPMSSSELAQVRERVKKVRKIAPDLLADSEISSFISSIPTIEEFEILASLPIDIAKGKFLKSVGDKGHRKTRKRIRKLAAQISDYVNSKPVRIDGMDRLDISDAFLRSQTAEGASFSGFRLSRIAKRVNKSMGIDVIGKKATTVSDLRELNEIALAIRELRDLVLNSKAIPRVEAFDVFDASSLVELLVLVEKAENLAEFSAIEHENGSTGARVLASMSDSDAGRIVEFARLIVALFGLIGVTTESSTRWQSGKQLGESIVEAIPKWGADAVEHDLMELGRWLRLQHELDVFARSELPEIVEAILEGTVPHDAVSNAFLRGYYSALVKHLLVRRGFHTFDGVGLDSYVRRLQDSYIQLRNCLPGVLSERLYSRRGFDPSARIGAIGDLLATLSQAKAPRGLGVRGLLKKYWDLITRITPCVLASPDSTVRFIDPELEPFDIVVFDEASQIKVAHALGALGRGKASIIAGDVKQMPPTSVAQISLDTSTDSDPSGDDFDIDDLVGADVESILSLCSVSRVPEVMLNWHYRSEDESLIAFSNAKYYGRKLLSFPSPDMSRDLKGLSFELVKSGTFVRPGMKGDSPLGTNLAEAKAILAEVARRAADDELCEDSLGIVTFNMPQRKLIEAILVDSTDENIQRALSEGLGGEEIFVKNLEQVQGKERDVILFSIAFSKNSNGLLPLNFGPLNNVGGQRRLNVAITRARKQVKVFCSFKPDELISRNPNSLGVKHLGEFLKMADEGADESQALFAEEAVKVNRHRARVAERLRREGLVVREELGLSGFKIDLAIYENSKATKAVLGVLLDGDSWSMRHTAIDRDALPSNVLRKKMGWPSVSRIWLPAWIRDEEGEVARVKSELALAIEESKKPRPKKARPKVTSDQTKPGGSTKVSTEQVPKSRTTRSTGKASAAARAATGTGDVLSALQSFLLTRDAFSETQPTIRGDQDWLNYLFDDRVSKFIRECAGVLTEAEGPISRLRFAKFVGACFSFARLATTRVDAINTVSLPGHQRDNEGFIYPKGQTVSQYQGWKYAVPGEVQTMRPIEGISLRELSNFAADVCRQFDGLRPDQIAGVVSVAFGFQRLTANIESRCAEGVQLAIDDGRLILRGEYLVST